MQSNRESAQRSCARKQQRVEELIVEASRLKEENAVLRMLGKVNNENAALCALHGELIRRLQARGSFHVTGVAADILEIPKDPLLLWHSPFTPQQVVSLDTQRTLGVFQVAGAAVDNLDFPNNLLCLWQLPFVPYLAATQETEQALSGFQVAGRPSTS
jgi:hypothetical protein